MSTHDEIQPGELSEPAEVEVAPLAVEAAKAELELETAGSRADARSRTSRTLLQGALAAVLMSTAATVNAAVGSGSTDYRAIGLAAGQAAVTALVTYLHSRVKPAA